MEEEEIPSVEYEDRGIPNDQDIQWIQQYHADLEAARAAELRQREAHERLEKERQSTLHAAEDDDSSSSSSGSDSDLADDQETPRRTRTSASIIDTTTNPRLLAEEQKNSDSRDQHEHIAQIIPELEGRHQEDKIDPSTVRQDTVVAQTQDNNRSDSGDIMQIETTTGKEVASNASAQPSAAADSLAAALLAKYKSGSGEAGTEAQSHSDDSSSIESDSSDDSDVPRLNHEELEAMILAEDGGGKKDYNPEMEHAEPAPKFPTVVANDTNEIEPVGEIHAFVDDSLHFWQLAERDQSEDNDRILLEGSVICLEDLRVVGGIYDMMGPMRSKKLYQIKYDKDKLQEIKAWNLTRGTKVYRVVPHSTWGHVNQFTAGDEAFDEVYEGDDDTQHVDDAEVMMRRAEEGGRGGRGGRGGGRGARDRGRGKGRGDRRGQGHPRGHNQSRGGRGNYGGEHQNRSHDHFGPNTASYHTPQQHGQLYGQAPPQAQSGITPQHFQALLMNLQQQQQMAQQGGQVMPPQPYINQGFAQQPAFNPFAAWGTNLAAHGQIPQIPQVPQVSQFGGWQQPNYQAPQTQTGPSYPQPSVPQFGGGLPQQQVYQDGADHRERGRGRGRGRGAGSRPRHPDDPPEW